MKIRMARHVSFVFEDFAKVKHLILVNGTECVQVLDSMENNSGDMLDFPIDLTKRSKKKQKLR